MFSAGGKSAVSQGYFVNNSLRFRSSASAYLNRTFSDFKTSLINYAKTYFPNTYNDFSPASPGMMFMEMSSYVGDILSFYLDNQFQENLLLYAKEKENLYSQTDICSSK